MDVLPAAYLQREPAIFAVVLLIIVAEYLWHRLRGGDGYDLKETGATAVIAAGQILLRAASVLLLAPIYLFVHEIRLFDIAMDGPLPWLGLFALFEFSYYWFHRMSHTVRWLWATHSVHHSSTRLNLTAAYRLGWTNIVSGGWIFFLPLMWLGFPPVAVIGLLAANLTYQLFLHTEVVRRLGPLEWVLNTPSHHRVHHATDAACRDRNYGGVVIVFDRLFGTFAAEPRDQRLSYGTLGAPQTYNPFRIAFREWGAMARDAHRVRGLTAKARALFGRP